MPSPVLGPPYAQFPKIMNFVLEFSYPERLISCFSS